MKNGKSIKRSLVLAGGGLRLAYHAGVLQALKEDGISFNHVDGTSGGIFGTAMMASGLSPEESAMRWRKLNLQGFMRALPFSNYLGMHRLSAMGSASGIRRKIFPALGIHVDKIRSNTAFDATFNVCKFSDKSIEAIHHSEITEDHLIAGMSLPMFMPAVRIGKDWYTDAVWIKDANLTEALRRGAKEVWLVWCIGNTREYLNGTLNQYVHMIEMSACGGLYSEIELLRSANASTSAGGEEPVKLYIIKPEYPLPLDPDFFLNRIDADTLINMGYSDTRDMLAARQPFDLNSPVNETTTMKDPGITVHFRQQFQGEVVVNGENLLCSVHLAFFIREINGQLTRQLYSSVSFDKENFISGFENRITTEKGGVEPAFMFKFRNKEHRLRLRIRVNNVTDFLLGLECKTGLAYLTEGGSESGPYQLYQPAFHRIKNAFYLYTKAGTGWSGRRKSKLRILNSFFEKA
ncbi:patatin-like phospholipase family protein [Flavihumibacter sp. R14]|nr:patatin-like phospholipase family protein [Flavihumibacter soli]